MEPTMAKPGAMSPQWLVRFFKNYVNFDGRAGRTEYWSVFGWLFIAGIVLGIIDAIIFGTDSVGVLGSIFQLAVLIPGIGLAIRRLHDTGKSGWFILIGLIPLLGFIALLVFYLMPSDEGANEYGPMP